MDFVNVVTLPIAPYGYEWKIEITEVLPSGFLYRATIAPLDAETGAEDSAESDVQEAAKKAPKASKS